MDVENRRRVRTHLADAKGGSVPAEELLPILYDELRSLARARLAGESPGGTLQATALVHEAWVRLVGDEDPGWAGRGHFFGAAARAMQRILVERARSRAREKRGGALKRVSLDEGLALDTAPDQLDLVALDLALARLGERDERKAEVVLLRHFAGLELEEIAGVLGISLSTVKADWTYARAWLHRELEGAAGGAREEMDR